MNIESSIPSITFSIVKPYFVVAGDSSEDTIQHGLETVFDFY